MVDDDEKRSCECKILKDWVAKPTVHLKAAVEAVYEGAWTSLTMSLIANYFIKEIFQEAHSKAQFVSICGEYKPLVKSFLVGSNFDRACNFAIMRGCNAGISLVMKNLTGKEDVQTSMVAGFGYGVVISLVTGMRGPGVMSVGVTFALFNAGMFKASTWGKAEA